MKQPKMLLHTWEDLTGIEEIYPDSMELLRLMLRTMMGSGPEQHLNILQKFFEDNAVAILSRPSSDMCAVLYRLLEQYPIEKLNETVAIGGSVIGLALFETTFPFGMFMGLVESSFTASKRPVSIVAGFRPEIVL